MVALLLSLPVSSQSLNETIVLAITNHPNVRSQELSLEMEQQQLKAVESAFLPQLSLALGLGREDSNNSLTRALVGSSAEMERREASLTLKQMLFDGFETHWRQAGQESAVASARYQYQYILSRTAVEASQVHLAFAKAERALAFNIESYRTHQEIADGVKARVESGKDDRAKIAQVDARLALSLTNLETSRAELARSRASYQHYIGDLPKGRFTLDDGGADLPETVSVLLQSVLANNPEYQAARLRLQSSENLLRASKGTNLPDLSFESGASWNANMDGVRGRNSDAYAMFRLSYDLYQGGGRKAEQRIAALARDRNSFDLDATERSLKEKAERLWHSFEAALTKAEYLESYVYAAQMTKEAYQKQFKIGQRSLIDLLDAENELLSARVLRLDVLEQLAFSRIQLLAVAGTLLDKLSLTISAKG